MARLRKPRAFLSMPQPVGKLGTRVTCQPHWGTLRAVSCIAALLCLLSSGSVIEGQSGAQQSGPIASGSSPKEIEGWQLQLGTKAGFPEKPWSRDMLVLVIINSLNPDINPTRCGYCTDGEPEAQRDLYLVSVERGI